jgi:GAF domain-containing protein
LLDRHLSLTSCRTHVVEALDNSRACGQCGPVAEDVAGVLERIAESLQQAPSPEETLGAITHAAVDVIDGAERAAVSLVIGRRDIETVAATDEVAEAIDRAQYETREGPCLDALYDDDFVLMSDMEAEPRWPAFTHRARDRGVRSMLCFRLFMRGDDAGALNLFAGTPNAFDAEAVQLGRLLATHAAVALASARKIDQLQHAVDSRDVIGQAKGVLMERHGIDADEAFHVLVRASQSTHIRLVHVATKVAQRD